LAAGLARLQSLGKSPHPNPSPQRGEGLREQVLNGIDYSLGFHGSGEARIMDAVDDYQAILVKAGWAATASHRLVAEEPQWRVIGSNGSLVIEGRGATQLDAWVDAVEQARALGLV
jgi:hypothetical protein